MINKAEEEIHSMQCFAHLFEECKQDWFAVASIIKYLLASLKREQPFISEAFLRSDNGTKRALAVGSFQPLVQERGCVSGDMTSQNHRQGKTYATER